MRFHTALAVTLAFSVAGFTVSFVEIKRANSAPTLKFVDKTNATNASAGILAAGAEIIFLSKTLSETELLKHIERGKLVSKSGTSFLAMLAQEKYPNNKDFKPKVEGVQPKQKPESESSHEPKVVCNNGFPYDYFPQVASDIPFRDRGWWLAEGRGFGGDFKGGRNWATLLKADFPQPASYLYDGKVSETPSLIAREARIRAVLANPKGQCRISIAIILKHVDIIAQQYRKVVSEEDKYASIRMAKIKKETGKSSLYFRLKTRDVSRMLVVIDFLNNGLDLGGIDAKAIANDLVLVSVLTNEISLRLSVSSLSRLYKSKTELELVGKLKSTKNHLGDVEALRPFYNCEFIDKTFFRSERFSCGGSMYGDLAILKLVERAVGLQAECKEECRKALSEDAVAEVDSLLRGPESLRWRSDVSEQDAETYEAGVEIMNDMMNSKKRNH